MHNKYATTPRFLLAMECLLFILRPVQILLWCKMWELDFGELDETGVHNNLLFSAGGTAGIGGGGVRHSMPAMPPGGGTHRVVMSGGGGGGRAGEGGTVGTEPDLGQPHDGYRPFIVPEAGVQQHQRPAQSSDTYIPPVSPEKS